MKLFFYFSILSVFALTACQEKTNPIFHENDSTTKIIGGVVEDKPWLHQIIYKSIMGSYYSNWNICSPFKLKEGLILSAAHCISDSRADAYGPNLYLQTPGSPKKTVFVIAVPTIYNPEFNSNVGFKDDLLALYVGLGYNFDNSGFELPAKNAKLPKTLYASGYGQQDYDHPMNNSDLADSVQLKTITIDVDKQRIYKFDVDWILKNACGDLKNEDDKKECLNEVKGFYQRATDNIRSEDMFCFETINWENTPGHGDSGGPLYALDREGQPVVYGVMSWLVWNLEKQNRYFCYTNLQKYRPWIEEKIAYQKFILGNQLKIEVKGMKSKNIENLTSYPILDAKKQNKSLTAQLTRPISAASVNELDKIDYKGKVAVLFTTSITSGITGVKPFYDRGAVGVIVVGSFFMNADPNYIPASVPLYFEPTRPFFVRHISSNDGKMLWEIFKVKQPDQTVNVSIEY